MLTPKINVYGMKWRFYKTDDDDHPSVPHGHSLDGNYKLQLWSGNIFNVQNGKISETRYLNYKLLYEELKNQKRY